MQLFNIPEQTYVLNEPLGSPGSLQIVRLVWIPLLEYQKRTCGCLVC